MTALAPHRADVGVASLLEDAIRDGPAERQHDLGDDSRLSSLSSHLTTYRLPTGFLLCLPYRSRN
ncbi:hypothetical protein G3I19_00330 [Streptomyces sp. SID10853]|uniref:hypothetical protein n=1 Tax=Streptomyces sp. SID10853 TaxID=2706028 RepID=UPI0013C1E2C8|nr:hypothetical protein [Streptomyces sp. SID10853]NDZ76991.1 hypothetical protein [Streptomyces sp. SID10853]